MIYIPPIIYIYKIKFISITLKVLFIYNGHSNSRFIRNWFIYLEITGFLDTFPGGLIIIF